MNDVKPADMNEVADVVTLALRQAFPDEINLVAVSGTLVSLAVKYLAVYEELGEQEAKQRLIAFIKELPLSDMESIDVDKILN